MYGLGSCITRLQDMLRRRSVITEVLGGELKFEFFHRWFNSLFLASVALTLLLFYGCAQPRLLGSETMNDGLFCCLTASLLQMLQQCQ